MTLHIEMNIDKLYLTIYRRDFFINYEVNISSDGWTEPAVFEIVIKNVMENGRDISDQLDRVNEIAKLRRRNMGYKYYPSLWEYIIDEIRDFHNK